MQGFGFSTPKQDGYGHPSRKQPAVSGDPEPKRIKLCEGTDLMEKPSATRNGSADSCQRKRRYREEKGYSEPQALPTYLLPFQCKPYELLGDCAFHFKTLGRKQRNLGTGTRKSDSVISCCWILMWALGMGFLQGSGPLACPSRKGLRHCLWPDACQWLIRRGTAVL